MSVHTCCYGTIKLQTLCLLPHVDRPQKLRCVWFNKPCKIFSTAYANKRFGYISADHLNLHSKSRQNFIDNNVLVGIQRRVKPKENAQGCHLTAAAPEQIVRELLECVPRERLYLALNGKATAQSSTSVRSSRRLRRRKSIVAASFFVPTTTYRE